MNKKLVEIHKELNNNVCLIATKIGVTDVRYHCRLFMISNNTPVGTVIFEKWHTPFSIKLMVGSSNGQVFDHKKAPSIKRGKDAFITRRKITSSDEMIFSFMFPELEDPPIGFKMMVNVKEVNE